MTNEEAITMAGSLAAGGSMEGAVKRLRPRPEERPARCCAKWVMGLVQRRRKAVSPANTCGSDVENSSQTQEARESGKRLSRNLASGESAIFTKGGGVSGDAKLTASLDNVKTAQHGYEAAVSTEASAKDSMKRAEDQRINSNRKFSQTRKFAQLAEANP